MSKADWTNLNQPHTQQILLILIPGLKEENKKLASLLFSVQAGHDEWNIKRVHIFKWDKAVIFLSVVAFF